MKSHIQIAKGENMRERTLTTIDFFCNAIFDYINEHHLSSDGKAFDEGWDAPIYEQVKLILKELED